VSGLEFDVAALVRVFNNTDLAVVRAAIAAVGLSDMPMMEAAVVVLAELDDEIRLLRRYRVAQKNASTRILTVIRETPLSLTDLLAAVANLTGLGKFKAVAEIISDFVDEITSANDANFKAARLADAKLDDLIETRGKIALILL